MMKYSRLLFIKVTLFLLLSQKRLHKENKKEDLKTALFKKEERRKQA